MNMRTPLLLGCIALSGRFLSAAIAADSPPAPQTIRCAIVGGLQQTDFWPDLADRFERASGHKVMVVASGPKHVVAAALERGEADLATMHVSDAIVNLVADGHAENLQPWLKNDMVLVGPRSDPAGVRGEKDAVAALRKIVESRSRLLVHASAGAGEVLHDLLAAGDLTLDPERTISLATDKHRQMLQRAAKQEAYTLVGRIPFLNGKLDSGGLEVLVQGDPRLRRVYLVVTARRPSNDARLAAARELAAFLRSAETQAWIANYGRGKLDNQPLFFPVRAVGE